MNERNLSQTQNCSSLFFHSYTIHTFTSVMLLYLEIYAVLNIYTVQLLRRFWKNSMNFALLSGKMSSNSMPENTLFCNSTLILTFPLLEYYSKYKFCMKWSIFTSNLIHFQVFTFFSDSDIPEYKIYFLQGQLVHKKPILAGTSPQIPILSCCIFSRLSCSLTACDCVLSRILSWHWNAKLSLFFWKENFN